MSKVIYVTVKIEVKDDADIFETMSEVDYHFNHENIISTEIDEVEEHL